MSKIKNGGLDKYDTEPLEQQQFGTASVERVNKVILLRDDKRDVYRWSAVYTHTFLDVYILCFYSVFVCLFFFCCSTLVAFGPVSSLYAYLNPSFCSPLSASITPSLFHSKLKTCLIGKSFPP